LAREIRVDVAGGLARLPPLRARWTNVVRQNLATAVQYQDMPTLVTTLRARNPQLGLLTPEEKVA
jgi:hypothetical protein